MTYLSSSFTTSTVTNSDPKVYASKMTHTVCDKAVKVGQLARIHRFFLKFDFVHIIGPSGRVSIFPGIGGSGRVWSGI